MKLYNILCIATSVLFIFLFFQLILIPDDFVRSMGLQPAVATAVLARRAAMFMLGISTLLFCSKNLENLKARQSICLSTGITLIGLAFTGIYEHFMGTVNNSIFIAITIETILGFSFLSIFFRKR